LEALQDVLYLKPFQKFLSLYICKKISCIKRNAVITKKLAQGRELPTTSCALWQTGLAKSTHQIIWIGKKAYSWEKRRPLKNIE
jgi:hypothetical protein